MDDKEFIEKLQDAAIMIDDHDNVTVHSSKLDDTFYEYWNGLPNEVHFSILRSRFNNIHSIQFKK